MRVRELLPSRRIVNMFGAIGYSVLLTIYAIVVGVVLTWLIGRGHLELISSSDGAIVAPADTPVDVIDDGRSVVMSVFAYTVTMLMTITVLFVLVALPYWLGKSGSYLLKRTIRLFRWPVTPITLLISKIIASGIVSVPILLLVVEDIGNLMTLLFISGLVVLVIILFLAQHYLARMTRLEAEDIW